MFTSFHISSLARMLLYLITAGALSATMLTSEVSGQERPGEIPMKRTEQVEAAAVLKALTKGWALVDSDPDVDFLILVNEDREELNFYPKKSFVLKMERLGLIENLDKKGSSVREPFIYYEADLSKGEWKEITEAGGIVFQYQVTPKGKKFLSEASKLLGRPVRPLRIARVPAATDKKPLKVVTYNRQAIQELVDVFVRQARTQVEAAFSPKSGVDLSAFSSHGLLCGPKLWQKLEPLADRNGLRPGLLLGRTYSMSGGKSAEAVTLIKDRPISAPDEVRVFWKTLHETIKFDDAPLVRRATASEAAASPYKDRIERDDFPPPNLSSMEVVFTVESNEHRFVVLVKSEPQTDMKHFGPEIRWIELTGSAEKQK